jgi:hypothetical protein
LSGCSAARLACLVRDQEVGGSNPLTPTIFLSSRYSGKIIMKQSLTIRIPDDLREELREISKVESKPVSDLVRESIQKYISIYRFHQLRDKVLPFAESIDSETDDSDTISEKSNIIKIGSIWKSLDISDEDTKDLFMLQMSSEAYLEWISPENDIYDREMKYYRRE